MGKTDDFYAITLTCKDGKFEHILFDIQLRNHVTHEQHGNVTLNIINYQKVDAVLDTGATISCITSRAAKRIGLVPIREDSFTHAKGKAPSLIYSVDVVFPKGKIFEGIEVAEISDDQRIDFLIGMNIIGLGDLALTSANGESAFSFRIPPAGRIIDFEKQPSDGPIPG
jgi:predicted aspartyl protease